MKLERVVEVTAEDIHKGRPGRCAECPVALAVLRAFPELAYAGVTQDYVSVRAKAEKGMYGNRRDWVNYVDQDLGAVSAFVHNFDSGVRTCQPFSFPLSLNLEY